MTSAIELKSPDGTNKVRLEHPSNVSKTINVANLKEESDIQTMIKNRAGSAGAFSFRNKIVDGRYDFWYEGTSQTFSGYGSNTMVSNRHTISTKTVSQQPLNPGVDLPAIEVPSATYFQRTVVTTGGTAASYVNQVHIVEGVKNLAGKTVTFSFYAKADAAKKIFVDIGQYFGSSGSPITNNRTSAINLTTSWSRYSVTVTLASINGKTIAGGNDQVYATLWFDAGATIDSTGIIGNQSGTFDIACVQLEEGSVATPFEELPIEISQTRVNRYFRTTYPYGTVIGTANIFSPIWYKCYSGDDYNYLGWIDFGTKMRVTPVVTTYSQITGASGKVADTVHVSDIASVSSPMDNGIMFYVNNTHLTYPVEFHWHYKADARL